MITKIKLARYTVLFFLMFTDAFTGSSSVLAQDAEAYEKAFKARYPTITAPMWIRKADSTYEATYKFNGAFQSSFYTVDGQWLFDKTPVDSAAVPLEVKNALQKKYPGSKIAFAEKLDMADKQTRYLISLKNSGRRSEALFDDKGNLVK